jgi:hypothetical protein
VELMAKEKGNKETEEEVIEEAKEAAEEARDAAEDARDAAEEAREAADEAEEVDDSKLPFPRATIVNMLRKHLSSGKQIKGQVKTEMNLWLGNLVERIAKKMDAYPYTYVDGSMFREAVEPYESMGEIEKEKERIIKELEAIKAACDVLVSEVDRKFVLRSSFARQYLKESGQE